MVSFMDGLTDGEKAKYLEMVGMINGHALGVRDEGHEEDEHYEEYYEAKFSQVLEDCSKATATAVENFFKSASS